MPRSGTSAVYRLVGSHPDVSRLVGTGRKEDEGQYVQRVYPTGEDLGAPGRYGLNPKCRLTETSPLVATARSELFDSWARYWDLGKPVLCEKSPSNITRSRFLQAVFPESSFIFVSRHPVAYSLAIRKWDYRIPVATTIRNWLACYRYLDEDLPHLRRSLVLRYDDFIKDTQGCTRGIEAFLELAPGMDPDHFKSGHNDRYFKSWQARDYRDGADALRNRVKRFISDAEIRYVEWRYEKDINAYGYSFRDFFRVTPTVHVAGAVRQLS
jgi:hypothetical protein